MNEVAPQEAEIAWLVYDLVLDDTQNRYQLVLYRIVYTLFEEVLSRIVTPQPGSMDGFMLHLQERLDRKLEDGENPPDAPILNDLL